MLWCDFSFFLLIRFAYFHKGTCRMIFSENMVNFMSIRFWSNYLPFELQLQKMFTLHFDMAHIFFLSFWKTVRKCWKNCALPVFFDNNNIKKEKSVSPLSSFSFCVLDSEAWEFHWLVLSKLANQQERPRHFLCFQLCTVIPLDHIYSGQISQKSVKRFIRLLFDFLMVHSVVYSET